MASGFGNVDNYQETIETTINNGIDFARSQLSNKSSEYCIECDCIIPAARRAVIKTEYCITCQEKLDKKIPQLFNRRGSKDSQLR